VLVTNLHYGLGQFDILYEPRTSIQLQQRSKPSVKPKRFLYSAAPGEPPHCHSFCRECIHKAGNPSIRTNKATFESEIVNARKDRQPVTESISNAQNPPDVVGALLYGNDIWALAKSFQHIGRNIDLIRHRVVVDHERQAARG